MNDACLFYSKYEDDGFRAVVEFVLTVLHPREDPAAASEKASANLGVPKQEEEKKGAASEHSALPSKRSSASAVIRS